MEVSFFSINNILVHGDHLCHCRYYWADSGTPTESTAISVARKFLPLFPQSLKSSAIVAHICLHFLLAWKWTDTSWFWRFFPFGNSWISEASESYNNGWVYKTRRYRWRSAACSGGQAYCCRECRRALRQSSKKRYVFISLCHFSCFCNYFRDLTIAYAQLPIAHRCTIISWKLAIRRKSEQKIRALCLTLTLTKGKISLLRIKE